MPGPRVGRIMQLRNKRSSGEILTDGEQAELRVYYALQFTLGNWHEVSTPLARSYGLELHSENLDSDFVFVIHAWYNPLVGYFLQYEQDGSIYHIVKLQA